MAEIKIDLIGGNCPVQADGTINGVEFYFRARGSRWSIGIGGDVVGAPNWYYGEPYGDGPYDAGWMTEGEARAFIDKAAKLYDESSAEFSGI
jgi:hypothetical protein